MNAARRRYVYGIALATLPLLTLAGIVTESAAPLWGVLAGVVLVPDLARRNVSDD